MVYFLSYKTITKYLLDVGELVLLLFTLCPVLNLLSVLIFIQPYRKFCLVLLGVGQSRVYASSVGAARRPEVQNENSSRS